MPLPRVQPIIPTARKQPLDDPGWVFDFKYDGFRALGYFEHRRCLLVSRNGNPFARLDELAALLDLDEAILDGEVIAADATGRPQFYELLRRSRALSLGYGGGFQSARRAWSSRPVRDAGAPRPCRLNWFVATSSRLLPGKPSSRRRARCT